MAKPKLKKVIFIPKKVRFIKKDERNPYELKYEDLIKKHLALINKHDALAEKYNQLADMYAEVMGSKAGPPLESSSIHIEIGKVGDEVITFKDSVIQRSSVGGSTKKEE